MARPIKTEPPATTLHIVYIDYTDTYDEGIYAYCAEKGVHFTSRIFDSMQYSDDRNYIYRLPAMHIYVKKIYKTTIYPNEMPLDSIDHYIMKYSNTEYKRKNAWSSTLTTYKKLFARKITVCSKAEETTIVNTPEKFDNPMQ